MGPDIPVELVGDRPDPTGYFRHLAVRLDEGPPDVCVPHPRRQIHGEDSPLVPGIKRGGLHSVELGRLDEVVLSHRDLQRVPIEIEVPKGDAVMKVVRKSQNIK